MTVDSSFKQGVASLAKALQLLIPGENWQDEHHQETAERVARTFVEMTNVEDEAFVLTTFASASDEMVIVQDIPFVSLCAHHILPFVGKAHIAYVPSGQIAGLSKFARAVKFYCKGLWVQEELTSQLCDFLEEQLEPKGVAVIMSGRHSCMEIRGVQAGGAITTTSAMRGVFLEKGNDARNEFLGILRNRSNLI